MTGPITNQTIRLYQHPHQSLLPQAPAMSNHATGSKHLATIKNGSTVKDVDYRTSLKKSLAMVLSAKHQRPVHPSKLGNQTKVSEQELFAALAHHKLSETNPALAERFAQELPTTLAKTGCSSSERSLLQATNRILRNMVHDQSLTRAQFREIRAYALGKAQLDTNRIEVAGSPKGSLNKGATPLLGAEEAIQKTLTNTIASESEVAAFRALSAKEAQDKQRIKHQAELSSRNAPVNATSSRAGLAHATTGPHDFLWKPCSDSDGNLVILLPASFASDVLSVEVLSADGHILAKGKLVGYFSDGRPIFRFTKPGASFPAGCVVQIAMRDGSIRHITITNPAERKVVNGKQ